MTMATNAYKTQTGTSNKAITELLIIGFFFLSIKRMVGLPSHQNPTP
jgi:hypothetical protein